jgi:hypothetical protein
MTPETAKEILINRYKDLRFDPEKHVYSVGDHTFSGSTTTFTKNFYEPFNTVLMTRAVADSYNRKYAKQNKLKRRSAAYYKKKWKEKSSKANKSGTRVHEYGEMWPNFPEPSCLQEQGVLDWWNALPSNYKVVALELRMYNLDLQQVGTADIILLNEDTGNLVIADYKTNQRNLMENYAKKKMKAPFNDMLETSLTKYKLQLSTYQLIIETTTDLKVEDRWVIWLKEGDHAVLDPDRISDKYTLDIHEPDKAGKYYKQFNLPDYSQQLMNWINEQDKSED